MQLMKIRAIIWDMGGVILRTEDAGTRLRIAEKLHLSRVELEDLVFGGESAILAESGVIPVEQHWRQVANRLGIQEDEVSHFAEEFFAGDKIDSNLVHFIRSLRPKYKTALLSNAWGGAREALERRFKVIDAFDVSVFSYEVGLAKPDVRIFRLILDRLEVTAKEAVFIDDFSRNIEGAQAAGMWAIHFENSIQAQQALGKFINDDQLSK